MHKIALSSIFVFVFCSTFSIALTQVAYYGGLVVWLALVAGKRDAVCRTPLDLCFALYLILELVTTAMSFDRVDALLHVQKRILLIPVVYYIFRFIDSRERIRKLILTLFASAALTGLFSAVSILLEFSDYAHYIKRFHLYNHYMTIGGLSMLLILLMTPFALHRGTSKIFRLTAIVGISAALFTLLFTYTRSSWLALAAGLIVLSVVQYRKILVLFIIAAAGIVIFGSPELHSRFISIFDPNDPSNAERLRMWTVSAQIYRDYPILGTGDINMMKISKMYTNNAFGFGHAHNNIVMWLLSAGVVGLIFILFWFLKIWDIFRKAYRRTKNDWLYGSFSAGALGAFAGFHVNGMFEWNFGDAEIFAMFWIIVGIVLSIGRSAGADKTW